MSEITKQEFLKEVALEIENIKKYATKEEIDNLNIKFLNPESSTNCIYGLMTGNCFSKRASKLIYKSCQRYCTTIADVEDNVNLINFIEESVNGKKPHKSIKSLHKNRNNDGWGKAIYFSSLEGYITTKGAKNKNIINYLKGKTTKLVL